MAKVADISTKLSLNNRDFKKGLQSTSKSLAKFHQAFKGAATRIAKAGAVALAAAGVAMVAIVKKTATEIDKISKEARWLDITTEMLGGLRHASALSGISAEKMGKSLVKMTKAVSEANVGLSTQVRAFEQLGLEVGDLMKMDAGEQFLTIADAFGEIENHSDKVRVAMDVFGRSGGDLLVTMEDGAEGIRKAIEEAKRLGITFSEEQAAMVEEANDSMTKLSAVGQGAMNQLTIGVAPFISLWTDAMTEAALEGESMTSRVTGGIEKIVKVIGVLGNAVNLVKGTVQFAFGSMQLVIFGTLKGLNESVLFLFESVDKLLRWASKVPGAKKLGIPAGINPDLTHEETKKLLREDIVTEFIAQGLFDAKKNIAAGKKKLTAGAMGFFGENLMADYHETLRKAAERAALIKKEHEAKKALRDANKAAEKALAEAAAKAAKAAEDAAKAAKEKAAKDAAKAAEDAKAAKEKVAAAGLRLVDEVKPVKKIVREVVRVVDDVIDEVQPLAKKRKFLQFANQAGPHLLGKKAKIGGFEADLSALDFVYNPKKFPQEGWNDPHAPWNWDKPDWAVFDPRRGADPDPMFFDAAKEKMKDKPNGGKAPPREQTLIEIRNLVQQIRDSKFVAFAS